MLKSTILLFIMCSLLACLPEQKVRVKNLGDASTEITDNTSPPAGEVSDLFGSNIKWFNSGLSSEVLTVNADNTKTIYLLGDQVHNFLLQDDNHTQNYCLEVRFQETANTAPKVLRVKVVPGLSNNFHLGQITRFFRVNLNTDSGNSYCNLKSNEIVAGEVISIQAGDTNYDGVVNGLDNSFVYQTQDVCPECLNILSSSKVVLYKNNENSTAANHSDDYLERVDLTQIKYDPLRLRIDMNGNSNTGGGSCGTTDCQASGFDCCVDGQCVNEQSIKMSGVQADPTGFAVAEQEKFINPNWFKNYPQFYYICLEQVPDDGSGGTGEPTDPEGEAATRLAELIADYQCVEELITNSESDPFHNYPLNNSATYSACNVTDTSDDMYYSEVMKRLYGNCGCSETSDLNAMVANCPAYTYAPVYQTDNNGNQTSTILAISCVTPDVDQTPLPFQDLEVIVNSKTAPHRFFDNLGYEITTGSPLPSGATGVQEGDKFEYLDDYFIFPRNFSFNMNSLLGEFNINLSHARPAKIIDVEFDKQYIISTLNGFYGSCTTCAKDSWFNNFSFAPSASQGVGLRPVGYTTRRDSYGSNLSLGNYEDTIFGRACFIPPTMIPWGHAENTDAQIQRQERLKTQAALYMNGYQRDWFGFNRGALIGSFDGVTWFAVGKGRIVKSTSTKLFLAINAPFADLASPTNHTVAVQEYDFTSSAARYDYVPGLEINDANQNEAASCQEYHSCETDAHCITKLGWEYACADVTNYQTKWPTFNSIGASEIANTSATGDIAQFLQQAELPPGSGTKRCVYRGAGAPCRVDSQNINDSGKRKLLTCAPNFYCADVDSPNVFNDEVARYARPLNELIESGNHYYGQDANILGRPKDYIAAGNLSSLEPQIITNLKENIQLMDSAAAGNEGICRPGKRLPDYASNTTTSNWDPNLQHQSADNLYRTDYISQIASCNSALYTDLRYSSCPMLDEEGNYIHTKDDFLSDTYVFPDDLSNSYQSKQNVTERYTLSQNACGLESLNSTATIGMGINADSLSNFSAFKSIEGRTLATSSQIVEQTLARDACLRKAGAVCHTDLDCSPNRMMAQSVDLVSESYFGNAAEKLYYEEYLVCGQAEPEPTSTLDLNFNSYTMHNNKCCRPIGETLTLFTEDVASDTDSIGLKSHTFGGLNPTDPDRYSRYSSSDALVDQSTKTSNLVRPTANTDLSNPVNITNANQWKTIHNNAAKICCGGSWVRQFADGTNNWQQNRLNLDVTKFSCLNSNTPLLRTQNPGAFNLTSAQLDVGFNNFCTDPNLAGGGCSESAHGGIIDDQIRKPVLNMITSNMTLDSDPTALADMWVNNPWVYHNLLPVDGSASNLIMNWDMDEADVTRTVIRTNLPAFIAFDSDTTFDVRLELPKNEAGGFSGIYATCVEKDPNTWASFYGCSGANGNIGLCADKSQWSPAGACLSDCCYTLDPNNRMLTIAHNNAIQTNPANFNNGDNLSARITFTAPGTLLWEQEHTNATSVTDTSVIDHRRSATPGNALYYLEKLSRLEYLGIPQMTYEPLYCNDNYQELVPGIFKENEGGQPIENVVDFINHPKTYESSTVADTPWVADSAGGAQDIDANLNRPMFTTSELVDHSPVFSSNKFMCCMELGSTTTNAANCCSGFAIDPSGSSNPPAGSPLICKLPQGTDLNVYFNKYVSGEGMSESYSDTTLSSGDFDAYTGEPLLSTSVLQKLNAIGNDFCENGATRRGAAYGNYPAEPIGPLRNLNGSTSTTQYTILDSILDAGNVNNQSVGYNYFNAGLRWNHHVYCDF